MGPRADTKAIFTDALELPPGKRAEFLRRACRDDEAHRASVEELLAAHEDAGRFLGSPTAAAAMRDRAPALEGPGARIGPYVLLQEIGEGGMGTVYMAEQRVPVERRVALKIIKPGMDTRDVVARFEQEKQALAVMDHPNVAKVLDAGVTETGRPYFAMELVKGVPITDYCDSHRLAPQERLELFTAVCRAVQHAHQKGIIHRDLKPGNVLVAEFDGRPAPKIIDFGVARATGQRLTEKTLFTAFGQVVGTVEYMSPEQATLNQLDVDTRSDVYSLGVLLYELLTGETPFDVERLRASAFDEMLRVIREEDPPKPSTRLSTSATLASVSAYRQTEPRALTSLVRGELDWIVMKALEKDRDRRYATASGLAEDVARYLSGEPVEAGPPSGLYRLRKLAGRHRGLLAGVASFAALLVVAVVVSAWLALRATRAEAAARTSEARAEARLAQVERGIGLLGSIFADLDPIAEKEEGRPLRAILGERLDQAALELRGEAVGDPLAVAKLQVTLARSQSGLGYPEKAVALLEEARGTCSAELGPGDPTTMAIAARLGLAYREASDLDRAVPLLEEAVESLRASLGPTNPETLGAMDGLARAYVSSGDPGRALPLFEEVLGHYRSALGVEDPNTLGVEVCLADAYGETGRLRDSVALLGETLARHEQVLGREGWRTLHAKSTLAHWCARAGELERARSLQEELLPQFRARLGREHPDTVTVMNGLAVSYRRSGRADMALPLLEEAFELHAARLGPAHDLTISTMNSLAQVYRELGQLDRAIALMERAVELVTDTLGPEHPNALTVMTNLAVAYQYADEPELAVPLFERTLTATERNLGRDHPDALRAANNLGTAYLLASDLDRALPLFEDSLASARTILGPRHPRTLTYTGNLAYLLVSRGEPERAVDLYREALEGERAVLGEEHPETLRTMLNLGVALAAADRADEAESVLRECASAWQRTRPEEWWTFEVERRLGMVLSDQGRFDEAEPILTEAYAGLLERKEAIPPLNRDRITQTVEALVKLYEAWNRPADAASWQARIGD